MNSVFITGIPTAGKTYLANKIATNLGILHVKIDDLREAMKKNHKLEPWVNMFWNKDEAEYYRSTPADEQWQNLVEQSEAFWPTVKRILEETTAAGKPAIFEGVNLLPHLMQGLSMKGVVLLGTNEEEILIRLKADPRWSNTEELQRMEAHSFFTVERPRYASEAERCGRS